MSAGRGRQRRRDDGERRRREEEQRRRQEEEVRRRQEEAERRQHEQFPTARHADVEMLRLDLATLQRVALTTEAWALRLYPEKLPESSSEESQMLESASLFTMAGSYWLLADQRRAAVSLGSAAGLHFADDSTYAWPLAICAGDQSLIRERLVKSPDSALSVSDLAHVLIGLGWTSLTEPNLHDVAEERIEAYVGTASRFVGHPVGRLSVPLDYSVAVVNAARAVQLGSMNVLPQLRSVVADYFVRADEPARAARSDVFHWQRLLTTVLPVEPEAAAVGALVGAAVGSDSSAAFVESLALPTAAALPLRIGSDIARKTLALDT